jgi:hypothetical protein
MASKAIPTPDAETVLCWIFQRDLHALTCEVDARTDRDFDVLIVPHWNVNLSVAEHFRSLPDALLRHAEIARRLRERGWAVAEHAHGHTPLAA